MELSLGTLFEACSVPKSGRGKEDGNVDFDFSEILGLFLPLSIGIVAQLAFLWLPVDLRNWRDDTINACTYVSLQLFVAAIVFIAIPRLAAVYHLESKGAFTLLSVVFVASWLRVVKIIPLEGTDPVRRFAPAPPTVLFTEFYDKDRLLKLSTLSESSPDDIRRIQRVKERVRKRGRESLRGGGLQAKTGL